MLKLWDKLNYYLQQKMKADNNANLYEEKEEKCYKMIEREKRHWLKFLIKEFNLAICCNTSNAELAITYIQNTVHPEQVEINPYTGEGDTSKNISIWYPWVKEIDSQFIYKSLIGDSNFNK